MATAETLNELQTRIESGHALLFLDSYEEMRWERELAELADEMDRGLVLWSSTHGAQPPLKADDAERSRDLGAFLDQIEAYPSDHLFLIKDVQPYLKEPGIVRKLRDLSEELPEQNKTLLLIGPDPQIPIELEKDGALLELPLPGVDELRAVVSQVVRERAARGAPSLKLSGNLSDQLVTTLLGFTEQEAHRALHCALRGQTEVNDEVFVSLVAEKKSRLSGSDLLEFCDLDDSIESIGGLDGLKEWLSQRAQAFSPQAREQGVPMPKGVLLFGVQGCGKSLTARAAAHLLHFPLIRLDMANLLSSDRGVSERNMRDVLRLVETLAPAVLWVDEMEKGFAGLVAEADFDSTVSRLFGRFLMWMEEKKSPVFVTATANSVTNLPPELLRRGRFDEMFFIDLPNYYERTQIFKVHLEKRGWNPEKFDIESLAEKTEGFSGAEIQTIVNSSILETYGQGRVLTQEALEQAREQTVPLSVTMEDRIFALREWARERCRPATMDSRVMKMLEDEDRALLRDQSAHQEEKWQELAGLGQIPAAVCECIRSRGQMTFTDLQEAFEPYTETQGDQGLALRSDPNIVLWSGLNPEFAGTLGKLIRQKRLYVSPVKPERYKDGTLKLPVLQKFSKDRLARPHWLPAVIADMVPENGHSRLERVTRMKLSHSS